MELKKNLNRFFLLKVFLLLLSFQAVKAQHVFQGTVKDEAKQPIASASVILKDSIGKIISYTYSDDLGEFVLQADKKRGAILSVSAIGFLSKEIDVSHPKEKTNVFDLVLLQQPVELAPIEIKSVRPITVEGDKIIFDAKSFSQGNEQVVEDLLKKIPGLNIESDGSIKVGNQEVEKVMINNDDMFEKGYKILTKNMPANPIDKIEIHKNYSNNKHLKGIEDSERVALNLTLKENYERQWFGNFQLGYGLSSENRYEVKGNLMNFGNKSKYYFLTNSNNIGYDATGDINSLIRSYSFDDVSSIGDEESANSLLSIYEPYAPKLKQERINFNKAEMLSLNSIFTLSNKTKLKLLGFFDRDRNDFSRESFQSFSVGNTFFENTENLESNKKGLIGFGKIDLTYDISKDKTLEYTGKFNKSNTKDRSDLIFNNDPLKERLETNNQLLDQKIVFTNKLKESKVLLLTGRYIDEKKPQNYSVNQFMFFDLFSEKANNTAQYSENKMQFAGVDAHLMNKRGNGDLLELKLGTQFRYDKLNTVFQLKKNDEIVSEPDNYQNNVKYSTTDLYFSAKYKFKFNKLSLQTQAGLHQLFNHLRNEENSKTQNPFFVNPKLGLEWEINDNNKIETSYSYNTTNADILDVYSGYIQTGVRDFLKGTNNFNQLNASNFILNYALGNWGDKFFVNTFLLYSKSHDFLSTKSLISQNFKQDERIVVKDKDLLSVSSSIDRYFKPIKSNLKLSLGLSKINFKNIVNKSELREVESIGYQYGFEMRSSFKGIFNYHIGTKWDQSQVNTTIKRSFTDNFTFLDLTFRISDKFNIQSQAERYYFGNLEKDNNTYYFVDLDAKYIIKQNKLILSLSGNNLFNTKTFRDYQISDISISKTEYNIIPRYILVKMEYRF
ncbi:carboxypeptidase regulatory-like domain-containing protein [Ornithobacterium rhinotracheale]|uniref:carboxypeptidase regulatory-like domain-containing protein n=1 Tax=Ornithobacterium rhinotracheale TaxID=28251 RepID=UPI00403530E7